MSTTVHVKGISSQTSENEIQGFFFGKIQNISVTPDASESGSTQSATVTFEKETAAKTALLLDNTQLGPSQIHVTSSQSLDQVAGAKAAGASVDDGDIPQEEKPRTRIVAEYLAHGYVLSDQVVQRAIQADQQHGISSRFTKALQDFDGKYKASERAQAVDQKYGISAQANNAWRGLGSYFEKAANTPTGQKLRDFYAQGQKQVLDVHNEAKHLAELKAGKFGKAGGLHTVGDNRTACNCGGVEGTCECAQGACACGSCPKNPDAKTTGKAGGLHTVGDNRTACNCGGVEGTCECAQGACACGSCPKNPDVKMTGKAGGLHTVNGNRTACNCGGVEGTCECAKGACACGSCPKNPDAKTAKAGGLHTVDGNRTACNCGGVEGTCECAQGACACGSCPKNPDVNTGKAGGLHTVNGDRTACNCAGQAGTCECAPGVCACGSCPKNPDVKTTQKTAEQAEMEKVGSAKTKCNCAGSTASCPCTPGECACSGCAKASPKSHILYPTFRSNLLTTSQATMSSSPQTSPPHTATTTDLDPAKDTTGAPLPLPAPSEQDKTFDLDMSSGAATASLDHLGPLVVNRDGTLSRIANWEQMTEGERRNTLRVLGKRNQLRREGLVERLGEGGGEVR
ncbi:Protein vip1 [Teratosphaeria destructans]|uniref:Protein vip1 n=1 Tax=Teratosphaeria destructans TaxID=418781 RepID=A0A9W7W366_9PEZI|nr:Protein vip1 [Teratosphaeria destructans]